MSRYAKSCDDHPRYQVGCLACRRQSARYFNMRALAGDKILVDATGTRRRIQALAVMGWPAQYLAQRLGVTPQAVKSYAARPRVRRDTAATIDRLFRELWSTPGPSQRARTWAAKHGWHGPLAWNNLDDPTEQPDTGTRTKRTIHPDDIAWLIDSGATWPEIEARTGSARNSIERSLARIGRGDILRRMRGAA